jgi:hypothetical protein
VLSLFNGFILIHGTDGEKRVIIIAVIFAADAAKETLTRLPILNNSWRQKKKYSVR